MASRIITDEILQLATENFDALLQPFADGGLAKPCLLVYPPRIIECLNCEQDVIGRKSSNIYKHGGPIPFPMGGVCPSCGGEGYFAQEVSETIHLKTEVVDKPNLKLPVDIVYPDGLLKVKGFLSDAPKVQQADYLLHNTAIDGYLHRKYKLYGEIISKSNIVQNRYFSALFKREK